MFYPVVSQKVQLEPLNSTVLQDSDVKFNAIIQGDWEVISWDVGGIQVLTIINSSDSIIPSVDRFSARFCFNSNRSCVEFTIHNVTRTDAGEVVCDVQGHQPLKAQLYVQGGLNTILFSLFYLVVYSFTFIKQQL